MPAAQFCVKGCGRIAAAAHRSRVHCRECYADDVLSNVELVRLEVIAPVTPRGRQAGVVDVRTQQTVKAPGFVGVDPDETNVAGLVAAGVARVAPADKPVKAAKGEG